MFNTDFSARESYNCSSVLTKSLAVFRITNELRMAECSPVSSLGSGNLTELDLGCDYKLKSDL